MRAARRPMSDIVGITFGRLTVLRFAAKSRGGYTWECSCVCGNTKIVKSGDLGRSVNSCGCLRRETTSKQFKSHGETKTRLYRIWKGMRSRCLIPSASGFKDYGGRGVQVCDSWGSYSAFRDWALSNGYTDNVTLERINVNGNYEPSNCTWIPGRMQASNTRSNKKVRRVEDGAIFPTVAEAARAVGVGHSTLGELLRGKGQTVRGYHWEYA